MGQEGSVETTHEDKDMYPNKAVWKVRMKIRICTLIKTVPLQGGSIAIAAVLKRLAHDCECALMEHADA